MGQDWPESFKMWAKPPSDTEEAKGSNVARMINEAVRDHVVLRPRNFTVYATGSYRNNTNIRLGSDVDVAIVLTDLFGYAIPDGTTPAQFGIQHAAQYGFQEFRSDVGAALRAKFGSDAKAGNKTIRIAESSSRLPADATPFLLHRHYTGRRRPDLTWEYHEGVEMYPVNEPGRRIVNWHQQHYDNGVRRNDVARRRFKRVTRILKRLRANMKDSGTAEAKVAAEPAASFLIECLVYNCPDSCFNKQDGSYYEDVKAVITHAWNQTKDDGVASKLVEVSEHKLLFGPHQGWTRAQAHEFLLRAWNHAELKS